MEGDRDWGCRKSVELNSGSEGWRSERKEEVDVPK